MPVQNSPFNGRGTVFKQNVLNVHGDPIQVGFLEGNCFLPNKSSKSYYPLAVKGIRLPTLTYSHSDLYMRQIVLSLYNRLCCSQVLRQEGIHFILTIASVKTGL